MAGPDPAAPPDAPAPAPAPAAPAPSPVGLISSNERAHVPAVLLGSWYMAAGSHGAMCDNVFLLHQSLSPTGSQEISRSACFTTLGGPWYLEHVHVWSHGGVAIRCEISAEVYVKHSGIGERL
eukprot:754267-Hanusia_phi.AAC.1